MSVIVSVEPDARDARALDRAIEVAKARGTIVTLVLHRPLADYSQESIDSEIDELSTELASREVGFTVTTNVGDDELAEFLVDFGNREPDSVIVVGIARRPAHGRMTLGTQIQRLLIDASCDVLVVREP